MSKVLFLCPTHRDHREIEALGLDRKHEFFFHDYASIALEELVADEPSEQAVDDVRNVVHRLIDEYGGKGLDAIVSTDDYPGSALASILAQAFGLPGVPPAVNLRCQHKYHSRVDQRRFAPEAVPPFYLLDEDHLTSLHELRFPVFLKPVKSFFSVGAHRADSVQELFSCGFKSTLQGSFFRPFETLLVQYAGVNLGPPVIVEGLLQGEQVTIEGFVHNGDVEIIGVVDSIMYPGTRSFQRFEYPSALPLSVQTRMGDIASNVMRGIGYDNGLFNIEMMYDARNDTVHIIETNPRMASQFADLYEKVDGTNTYDVLLDLALGKKPVYRRTLGRHRFAASCVLRTFENAFVNRLPSAAEIAAVRARYSDIRVEVLATQGRRLSQEMQDGQSYRYGIVSIGGGDRADVLSILDDCCARLTFRLDSIVENPTTRRVARAGGR